MPRKKKTTKKNLATLGRAIQKEQKTENVAAVSGFILGEQVQYYDKGWRVGYVKELPTRGLNRGRARIAHMVTERKVWVDGTSLKKLE